MNVGGESAVGPDCDAESAGCGRSAMRGGAERGAR